MTRPLPQIERHRAIWEMRQTGATYRAIGEVFGITGVRVSQLVARFERRIDEACNIYGGKARLMIQLKPAHNFEAMYGITVSFVPDPRHLYGKREP
jgi:hypothetical protein